MVAVSGVSAMGGSSAEGLAGEDPVTGELLGVGSPVTRELPAGESPLMGELPGVGNPLPGELLAAERPVTGELAARMQAVPCGPVLEQLALMGCPLVAEWLR